MIDDAPDDTLVLRPRITPTAEVVRPTRAEIDLDAIEANLAWFTARVPHGRVLAVVKADAYGHGAVPVARRLERAGVEGFAVALVEEALELRDAGVTAPILVLNGVYGRAHRALVDRAITPVLHHPRDVAGFVSVLGQGESLDVHVKFDTGMARLGAPASEVSALLEALARAPSLHLTGVMTHLASADVDPSLTRRQLAAFEARIAALGARPRLRHAANTAATVCHPESHYDAVRVGIGLFGDGGLPDEVPALRPAMRLRSAVVSLRWLAVGEGVGYGHTHVADRPTRVATVPIGYADGVFRASSNRGEALVGGRRCRMVGNVSMDLLALDVTDVPEVAVGDEVVLLGAQGGVTLTAAQVAGRVGTIAYEVLTNVSRRVPRFYLGAL